MVFNYSTNSSKLFYNDISYVYSSITDMVLTGLLQITFTLI